MYLVRSICEPKIMNQLLDIYSFHKDSLNYLEIETNIMSKHGNIWERLNAVAIIIQRRLIYTID